MLVVLSAGYSVFMCRRTCNEDVVTATSTQCMERMSMPIGPCVGVTSLDDKLYVLREHQSHINVYSTTDYNRLPDLPVPELNEPRDIASCGCKKCLYISESSKKCIHRVQLNGSVTKWSLTDEPCRLSVTSVGNVLTCAERCIVELSGENGQIVRRIQVKVNTQIHRGLHATQMGLRDIQLLHCVQLASGGFVTCHDREVCVVGFDGRVTRNCNISCPWHLAVDKDSQFIFVATILPYKVVLLSPTLDFVREITQGHMYGCEPRRVHLDPVTYRLYVGFSNGSVIIIQLL